MLVDLGRNDLGRVCGRHREGAGVLRHRAVQPRHAPGLDGGRSAGARPHRARRVDACFPAGTLSGAPKPRAMEIIEELEPTRRGLYGGMVGYLDFARRRGHGDHHPHRPAPRRHGVRPGRRRGSWPTPSRRPRTPRRQHKARAVMKAIAAARGRSGAAVRSRASALLWRGATTTARRRAERCPDRPPRLATGPRGVAAGASGLALAAALSAGAARGGCRAARRLAAGVNAVGRRPYADDCGADLARAGGLGCSRPRPSPPPRAGRDARGAGSSSWSRRSGRRRGRRGRCGRPARPTSRLLPGARCRPGPPSTDPPAGAGPAAVLAGVLLPPPAPRWPSRANRRLGARGATPPREAAAGRDAGTDATPPRRLEALDRGDDPRRRRGGPRRLGPPTRRHVGAADRRSRP